MAGHSKLHDTIIRIIHDEAFAEEVRAKAKSALQSGPGTQEFAEYFDLFSLTPGQLAHLGPNALAEAGCTGGSVTMITLSSVYTPISTCCYGTTTLTTAIEIQ